MAQPQAIQRERILAAQAALEKNHLMTICNAGTPTDGTTGDGVAGPGCLCIDYTNCELYQNIGTLDATVWTLISNTGSTS